MQFSYFHSCEKRQQVAHNFGEAGGDIIINENKSSLTINSRHGISIKNPFCYFSSRYIISISFLSARASIIPTASYVRYFGISSSTACVWCQWFNPLATGNSYRCYAQHCGCWWPGALAPGHQHPQYWLITFCTSLYHNNSNEIWT